MWLQMATFPSFFTPVYYSKCFFTWVPGHPGVKSSVKKRSGSRGGAWAALAQQRCQQGCVPLEGEPIAWSFYLQSCLSPLARGPSSICKAHHSPTWLYWHISFFWLIPPIAPLQGPGGWHWAQKDISEHYLRVPNLITSVIHIPGIRTWISLGRQGQGIYTLYHTFLRCFTFSRSVS